MINKPNFQDFCKKHQGCVLGYGHFNSIHPGHIRYLKYAKSLKKKFVVAVLDDVDNVKFSFSQEERIESLKLLNLTDEIFPLGKYSINQLLENLKPSILILGNEYQKNNLLQETINLQKKLRGKVQFHAGDIHYASSDLLEKSQQELLQKRKIQFLKACQRQKIKIEDLLSFVDEWSNTNLIVLGDTIVDQYSACEAIGMSAEAPVVVVRELENRDFIGGAGIVASHIKALGAKCTLVSVVGNDAPGELVKKELNDMDIGNSLITDHSRPTTFKKRYIVENQKLFRVSRMQEHNIAQEIEDKVLKEIEKLAPFSKGVVISDFVYGVITPKILEGLQILSEKYKLLLFGDLQCSSQVGSILKFKNYDLLCPNEREARIALQDKDSGLEQLSMKMIEMTSCKNLIMKIGSEGFIAYENVNKSETKSQSFPALSINPIDVTGAGDSLLALISTALSSEQSLMSTSAIACCMTSLAVEKMGNSSISSDTLKSKIIEFLE